jgi:hypothetical protein
LNTFARPTGRATRVIITEYDLPRKIIQPHDVIVDADGMVWFSHFGEQFLSKLDPQSCAVTEFPIPEQKPGFPTGTLDLEADEDGNLWIGLMYQSGIGQISVRRKNSRSSYSSRMAKKYDPTGAHFADRQQDRRQNLGEELRWVVDMAARCSNRPLRKSRLVRRAGHEQADHNIRYQRGPAE